MKRKAFKEIKNWMEKNARPLEVARFHYLFENGSKEDYYTELQKYQNKDGGFGYGLEPDSMNPFSSPIQTWAAFELIQELDLPRNDSMIKGAINYLTQTPYFENGFWFATIPTNENYPHAPWWDFSEEGKIWGYNPTAAIAGFIFSNSLKEANRLFARTIVQQAITDFLKGEFKDMHEIRSFIELYEYTKEDAPFEGFKEFKEKLEKTMLENIERKESLWFTTYCVRPSQFVYKKNMVGYSLLHDFIHREVEIIEDYRKKDDVWPVTWDWSESYPEDFEQAKQAWKGVMAISNMKLLHQIT